MSFARSVRRRLLGGDLAQLQAEVAQLRELAASINHEMVQMRAILGGLNHDVRSGAGDVLPMFLGYAERFRTDADTMVGVTELIDRQLALITQQVDRLVGEAGDTGA
jgi:hypothetical protein